jgi:hypothetical protein
MINIVPRNKRLKVSIEEPPAAPEKGRSLIFLPDGAGDPSRTREEYVIGVVQVAAGECTGAYSPGVARVLFPKKHLETITLAGQDHCFVMEEYIVALWIPE